MSLDKMSSDEMSLIDCYVFNYSFTTNKCTTVRFDNVILVWLDSFGCRPRNVRTIAEQVLFLCIRFIGNSNRRHKDNSNFNKIKISTKFVDDL